MSAGGLPTLLTILILGWPLAAHSAETGAPWRVESTALAAGLDERLRAAGEDDALVSPTDAGDGVRQHFPDPPDAPVIRYQALPPPAAAAGDPLLEDQPPLLRIGAGFSLYGEGVVLGEVAIDHQLWRTDLRRSAIIASVAIRL